MDVRVGQQGTDGVGVVVSDRLADEPCAELLVEGEIEQGLTVRAPPLGRDVVDAATDQVAVAVEDDIADHETAGTEPAARPLRQRVHLVDQFLSPIANRRNDAYGGELENRMRFPLEVISAVRAVIPEDKPLLVRISAVDGVDEGWTLEESVIYGQRLREIGVVHHGNEVAVWGGGGGG